MQCDASYLLARDDDESWPSGDWRHCPNEAIASRTLHLTDEVLILVHLCEGHNGLLEILRQEQLGAA